MAGKCRAGLGAAVILLVPLLWGCQVASFRDGATVTREHFVGIGLGVFPLEMKAVLHDSSDRTRIADYGNGRAIPFVERNELPVVPGHLYPRWVGRVIASGGAAIALTLPGACAVASHDTLEAIARIHLDEPYVPRLQRENRSRAPGVPVQIRKDLVVGAAIRAGGRYSKFTCLSGYESGLHQAVPVSISRADKPETGDMWYVDAPSTFVIWDGRGAESAARREVDPGEVVRGTRVHYVAVGRSATRVCQRPAVRQGVLRDLIHGPALAQK
jgi:hypothetical protein